MKSIVIAVIMLLLAGCCSQRKIATSASSDSVRIVKEIEYIERLRDTTIYVEITAESRTVFGQRDSSLLETSAAYSEARINSDGTLFHSLENKARPVPVKVVVKDTEVWQKDASDSISVKQVEIPIRMPLRWYEKMFLWWGIVSATGFVLWAAYKTACFVRSR